MCVCVCVCARERERERERDGERGRQKEREGGRRREMGSFMALLQGCRAIGEAMPLIVKRKGELSPGFLNVG